MLPEHRDESDTSLLFAKRARRRLIGAVALVLLAAIVLPMVMDRTPRQNEVEVQIHIPGQNEAPPFNPPLAPPPEEKPAVAPAVPVPAAPHPEASPPAPSTPAVTLKPARIEKPEEKPDNKPAASVPQHAQQTQGAKPQQPPTPEEAKRQEAEARRAAAILSGASPNAAGGSSSVSPPSAGQYVIQIGAFSNQANLKQTQNKLGSIGIKTYTEALSLPKGSVTRLRAGPFPSHEAAEKALRKMKDIGISGEISAHS
ncbi:MAG: SPOR domain-containing protein [Betaproteobacteria bacterium]|nr:SPOR domain-containing protein [Betaproteobacteria bacterium]